MDIDAKKLNDIAALMEAHGLSRVRLAEEDGPVIELERMGAPMVGVAAVPEASVVAAPVVPTPSPALEGAADNSIADSAPLDMASAVEVNAPMVGVFYVAPSPGAEPFVKKGSRVRRGDTLCVIEAMKLMNEVTAEVDGEIVDVCANDGDLVEYGCCLMKIAADEEA